MNQKFSLLQKLLWYEDFHKMASTTLKGSSEQNPFDEKGTDDRNKKIQILKIRLFFFQVFSSDCLDFLKICPNPLYFVRWSPNTDKCNSITNRKHSACFDLTLFLPWVKRHTPWTSNHSHDIRLLQRQVWRIDGCCSHTNTPVTSEPVAWANSGSCTHNLLWLILHISLSLLLTKAINPNYGRQSSSSCCHISQQR